MSTLALAPDHVPLNGSVRPDGFTMPPQMGKLQRLFNTLRLCHQREDLRQ